MSNINKIKVSGAPLSSVKVNARPYQKTNVYQGMRGLQGESTLEAQEAAAEAIAARNTAELHKNASQQVEITVSGLAQQTQNDLSATNQNVTDAQNLLTAIEAVYDDFDDRYLGPYSSEPTVDNDGDPLAAGQIYYNTVLNAVMFYTGTVWRAPSIEALNAANNAQTIKDAIDIIYADIQLRQQDVQTNTDLSLQYKNKAMNWAVANENVEVDPGMYSSKHYAIKAAASKLSIDSSYVQINTWQSDVNSKHTEVSNWHSEIDAWQQEVETSKDLTFGWKEEAKQFSQNVTQQLVYLGAWNLAVNGLPPVPDGAPLKNVFYRLISSGVVDGENVIAGDEIGYDYSTSSWYVIGRHSDGTWNVSNFDPTVKADKSHTHTAADLPNGSIYAKGIVQLSDSVFNTSMTMAATAGAVKFAHDQAVQAQYIADSKADAIHGHTASDLPDGSTSAKGILQLNNTVFSTSTTLAATANAVKTAYDKAVEALGTGAGPLYITVDANERTAPGYEFWASTSTHLPPNGGFFLAEIISGSVNDDNDRVYQKAIDYHDVTNTACFERSSGDGGTTWTVWQKILTTSDLSDSTITSSSTTPASSAAVKIAYDKALSADNLAQSLESKLTVSGTEYTRIVGDPLFNHGSVTSNSDKLTLTDPLTGNPFDASVIDNYSFYRTKDSFGTKWILPTVDGWRIFQLDFESQGLGGEVKTISIENNLPKIEIFGAFFYPADVNLKIDVFTSVKEYPSVDDIAAVMQALNPIVGLGSHPYFRDTNVVGSWANKKIALEEDVVLKEGGTFTGNILINKPDPENAYLSLKANDNYVAEIRAFGTSQGTGVIYVGQSPAYGGGIFYNGDGTPGYANGESSDRISLFRRTESANHVVMEYSHTSNNVTFKGNVTMPSYTVTSDLRLKEIKSVIKPIDAANTLNGIEVVEYDFINGEGEDQIGFIAQDFIGTQFEKNLVRGDENQYALDYRAIAVLLHSARQHDLERIKELETKVEMLMGVM